MACNVLITGGAGFIGSHLADELLRHGYRVRVLDCLVPQVHGPNARRPAYLDSDVELIKGDVRDADAVKRAMKGIEAVFHFAAIVGAGQSMYEIEKYTSVNNLGTAVLLEAVAAAGIRKLVVASSMSIYGEGLYRNSRSELHHGAHRSVEQLKAGKWELYDEKGEELVPVPTPETKHTALASVYALSKYDQEQMSIIVGNAYQIPVMALRFFNVYGTRQSLSNPYTGVLAIFASRLLNGNSPRIFEDGMQQRDFVSVHDVAAACRGALECDRTEKNIFNIGSGACHSVNDISRRLARLLNREYIQPHVTGNYRSGDIRHCFADIREARTFLGYEPKVQLEEGLVELVEWLNSQHAFDYVAKAHAELSVRGLTL